LTVKIFAQGWNKESIFGEKNVATTQVSPLDQESITSPRVLLCEGSGDKNFFAELIAKRGLPDFYITHPREGIDPGGRPGFSSRLRGLRLQHGFDAVRGIIIASDNDDDQRGKFREVHNLIHDALFRAPNRDYMFVAGPPAIAVMMIPQNECGQLETLCLRAIENTNSTEFQCARQYGQCMGINQAWSQGKREKAMLRALISHICKRDPNTSLSYLWHDNRETVFSVEHNCFTPIADFLGSFDRLVAAV
jgi:hypothetical protein